MQNKSKSQTKHAMKAICTLKFTYQNEFYAIKRRKMNIHKAAELFWLYFLSIYFCVQSFFHRNVYNVDSKSSSEEEFK